MILKNCADSRNHSGSSTDERIYPITDSLSDESRSKLDGFMSRIKADLSPVADSRLRSNLFSSECPESLSDDDRSDLFNDYLAAKLRGDFEAASSIKKEWRAPVLTRAEYSPAARGREGVLFQVGCQDVKVKHQNVNYQWSPSGGAGGGIRGCITKLSRKALQRMKLHARNVPDGTFKAILTLTYPMEYSTDGREVKRHFELMKKWLQRNGCGDAFWFLEFQRRGAPHFHLLLKNWPSSGIDGVSRAWHQIVGTDDKKHLEWHLGNLSGTPCLEWLRNPHAASAYVTKYASKKEQKDVPADYQNVGRFWGYWGEARPVWKFVSGSGSYSVGAAWSVVLAARSVWEEDSSRFASRPMLSSTMWGGASEFDELLSSAGWVPF